MKFSVELGPKVKSSKVVANDSSVVWIVDGNGVEVFALREVCAASKRWRAIKFLLIILSVVHSRVVVSGASVVVVVACVV